MTYREHLLKALQLAGRTEEIAHRLMARVESAMPLIDEEYSMLEVGGHQRLLLYWERLKHEYRYGEATRKNEQTPMTNDQEQEPATD